VTTAVAREDGYAPIRDYAAIGDGRALALVARDGSIDWLALPWLDSRPVFARLLDARRGGTFELEPTVPAEITRRYLDDTNVLETSFTTDSGTVRVTDAVTLDHGGLLPWFELVRRVEGVAGAVPMRWGLDPRPEDRIERLHDTVLLRSSGRNVTLNLFDAGPARIGGRAAEGTFETSPGSDSILVLRSTHDEPIPVPRRDWCARRIAETAEDWRRWLDEAGIEGPWETAVRRSILALRLLTHVATGAIAAAATTSLPERIGGDRNYDYRFAWVRDSAYTLDALINVGLLVQVHASIAWLLDAVGGTEPDVRPLYDLRGETVSGERELDLVGYRGSRPVREGNPAAEQLQLGCYGDLLETAELYVRADNLLDETSRDRLAGVIDHLCGIWQQKDAGIWELEELEHYTSSKISAWAALDRALRLVERGQLPADRARGWRNAAEELRGFVERECWSDERGAYVMYAGADKLDAAVLRGARLGFADPGSGRLAATIEAIRAELGAGGALLYRYSGQEEVEGAFVACSFWLADALARAGRLEEAHATMDSAVALANDVGLFAEEIDPATGAFLGNFPQGLSHLALINAAASISNAER
jgi:GH15 family glucan-1,4-alpha-glucosidase